MGHNRHSISRLRERAKQKWKTIHKMNSEKCDLQFCKRGKKRKKISLGKYRLGLNNERATPKMMMDFQEDLYHIGKTAQD